MRFAHPSALIHVNGWRYTERSAREGAFAARVFPSRINLNGVKGSRIASREERQRLDSESGLLLALDVEYVLCAQ